jgi:chemotaxis signal transduction protein
MKKRAKSISTSSVSNLTHFMSALQPDQKSLTEIQAVYDNLTLLGQLLGAGTDISNMRTEFNNLASVLLDQLAQEHFKKSTMNLGSCARVTIDVLTRNLFERTADIGFLATDSEICAFAEAANENPEVKQDPQWKYRLHSHFTEYVKKYSVYHNIILLTPEGEVLVQLDDNSQVTHTQDELVEKALKTKSGYIEIFRPTDLLPDTSSPLIYAFRVMSKNNSRAVGVLCLCFRMQDECQRIFEGLIPENDWTVITLLDPSGLVIASSDQYQFPIGHRIEQIPDNNCNIIHFGGRQYLATTRTSSGYQGYPGPGWVSQAMAPINLAFETSGADELEAVPDDLINRVIETATLFSQDLRDIPSKAANIQQELNRAVWNGNIWLTSDNVGSNAAFAKVLLREFSSTGIRTLNVFSKSTNNLYKTVISSVLFDCGTQAALAIDIMDRNLYERANDCRWWALTRCFSEELAKIEPADPKQRKRLTDVLKAINSLYTVYSNLILFDQSGKVAAVSNPDYNHWIGQALPENWVRPTLSLKNTQSYNVSEFTATDLYAGQPTFVFSAAVRKSNGSKTLGGISIVFDSTPQFEAMLRDVLPKKADGELVPSAFAVFAERDGRIISSSDSSLIPGSLIEIGKEFFNLERGESCSNIIIYKNCYYAVGSCMSAGYREYKSANDSHQTDIVALIFSPLSDRVIDSAAWQPKRNLTVENYVHYKPTGEETVDIASFYIGNNFYGIETSVVVEAIDSVQLTSMPLTSTLEKGCLIHQGHAVTIFNLSDIVHSHKPAVDRRASNNASIKPQILILRSAKDDIRLGILVDRLADITEVPVSNIDSSPNIIAKASSLFASVIKPPEDSADRRILMVLSIEKIIQRFSSTRINH